MFNDFAVINCSNFSDSCCNLVGCDELSTDCVNHPNKERQMTR